MVCADLEEKLALVAGRAGAPFEERAAAALWAYADHVLLGEHAAGLAALHPLVAEDVSIWLDEVAGGAAQQVEEWYGAAG